MSSVGHAFPESASAASCPFLPLPISALPGITHQVRGIFEVLLIFLPLIITRLSPLASAATSTPHLLPQHQPDCDICHSKRLLLPPASARLAAPRPSICLSTSCVKAIRSPHSRLIQQPHTLPAYKISLRLLGPSRPTNRLLDCLNSAAAGRDMTNR